MVWLGGYLCVYPPVLNGSLGLVRASCGLLHPQGAGPPPFSITKASSTLTPNASVPPWSFRVWGRSKFPEGRWSIERFIDSIEKPRDLLSLDPCFFGWKNSWAKFWMMRFYEILQDVHFVFFLCSRHENSYFVVKPHGGGFLLKCRFTRVTLLSPNFLRICFWKSSFWVYTPAT